MNKMRKKTKLLIFILILSVSVITLFSQKAFYEEAKKHVVQIAPEKAKKMLDEGGISLFDVRSEKEYLSGTIEDSVNIPWKKIVEEITKYVKDKEQKIIVFCYSGGRATMAAYKLMKAGYKNVLNIEGGITAWKEGKLPVVIPKKKQDKKEN
jgi:rhodanese-related sulfurtransferase